MNLLGLLHINVLVEQRRLSWSFELTQHLTPVILMSINKDL